MKPVVVILSIALGLACDREVIDADAPMDASAGSIDVDLMTAPDACAP